MNWIRNALRKNLWWVKFQELNREGWSDAFRRIRIQKMILKTKPLHTARSGATEVHVLTWRRDWMNAAWAIKSFYHFSGVDYPLYLHDGGLEEWQVEELRKHFPEAKIIRKKEADDRVEKKLAADGFTKCIEYRRQNVATYKVFDFFLYSEAEQIISIDSDIVFFKNAGELVSGAGPRKNLYNKDLQYAYSMSLDELEKSFGIRPPALINSGLSTVNRSSIDFRKIENWLKNEKLFADKWVTEQTLHALCSTVYGVDFLSDQYCVSTSAGLRDDLVCKHYPGFFRPLLYQEGMNHLATKTDFMRCWLA